MDEWQASEFLAEMQRIWPQVIDLEEAYTSAMSHVREYDGPRWFGSVGDGAFYLDDKMVLWYPDTTTVEAMNIMGAEFGEELTSELEYV